MKGTPEWRWAQPLSLPGGHPPAEWHRSPDGGRRRRGTAFDKSGGPILQWTDPALVEANGIYGEKIIKTC